MSALSTTPFSRLRDFDVFAVGSTDVQITWRGVSPSAELAVGTRSVELPTAAGATVIDELEPDCEHIAIVRAQGRQLAELRFRTRPDLGTVTSRFATLNDVHLGLRGFGIGKVIREDRDPPFALRAARAAIQEALEWGAEAILVKGDLTEAGRQNEWDMARDLFADCPVPFLITGGNHDGMSRAEMEPADGIARAGAAHEPVQTLDLDGIRIVLAETSIRRKGTGTLRPIADQLVDACNGADTPVWIGMHHNLQHLPLPWFWPPGVSSTDAAPVLRRLEATGRTLFLSSGHTHRNRTRQVGPTKRLWFSEVASSSDYPGVWAGYEVSANTIRQTVRRIAEPSVIEWSERARKAVFGVWPRWSQGRLHDRCIDVPIA